MQLISTDDHVIEHPRVWLDRLPAADHDGRAPSIVDDRRRPGVGLTRAGATRRWRSTPWPAAAGRTSASSRPATTRSSPAATTPSPGWPTWTPTASGPSCASRRSPSSPARSSSRARTRRWRCAACRPGTTSCSTSGAPPPPTGSSRWPSCRCGTRQLAAKEAERVAAKGARTISFPENPAPLGLPSFHTDHWDPVFAVAEEARDAAVDALRLVGQGAVDGRRRPVRGGRSPSSAATRCTPPPTCCSRRCSTSSRA